MAFPMGEAGEASLEIKLLVVLWGEDEQWKHVSLEFLFDIDEEAIVSGAPMDPKLSIHNHLVG